MSPSAVASHILQSLQVLVQDSLRIVLNRHLGELGRQCRDCLGREGADFSEGEDGVFRHDARRCRGPEGIKALERFLERAEDCVLDRFGTWWYD